MLSAILPLVVAAALILLATRRFVSSPKLNLPYLELEGDQSRTRYAAESVNLMSKGYTRVSSLAVHAVCAGRIF